MPQVLNKATRNFASDNNAGVHPEVLEAIARANQGHVVAYGDDPFTRSAIAKFEEHFGPEIAVFFTFNGTGANVLSLQSLNRSYHAVLCSEFAHIYTDECGAPEKHTGCKLIPLPHQDGKITLDSVRHAFVQGMDTMLWVCGGIALASAILAVIFLPRRAEGVLEASQGSGAPGVPAALNVARDEDGPERAELEV